MLNIYVGRESLPLDKKFIYNVDSVIYTINLLPDEFTKMVLLKVDKGSYLGPDRFTDRFGYPLRSDCLSTSSKILLGAHYTSSIINATEIGSNALQILMRMRYGNVYFDNMFDELEPLSVPFSVNGVVYNDPADFVNLGDNYHASVFK